MDGWMDGHTPTPDCIADDTSCPAEWRGIVNIISTMSVIKGYHSVDYDRLWPCIGGVLWCAHYCVCTAAGNQFPWGEWRAGNCAIHAFHNILVQSPTALPSLSLSLITATRNGIGGRVDVYRQPTLFLRTITFCHPPLESDDRHTKLGLHVEGGAVSCQLGSQGREIDGSGAPVV